MSLPNFTDADRAAPENQPDRYVAEPTGAGAWWCVWDTVRDQVVYGYEALREDQARQVARRLNEAYRSR
jgi:hypothetical protein